MKLQVVYSRYSTDMQSKTSIADQERECLKRAAELGFDVDKIECYADEALSGSKAGVIRPNYNAMMERVKAGEIDVIFAHEFSRLSRHLPAIAELLELCKKKVVRIICVLGGIDTNQETGLMAMLLNSFVGNFEIENTRGRVKRNHAGLLARHCVLGRPPFGYRIQRNDPNQRHLGARFVQVEEEAKIVKQVFELRYQGLSYGKIAETINQEWRHYLSQSGVRPKKGYWTIGDIAGVIGKPIYRGEYTQCNSPQYHHVQRKSLPPAMQAKYKPDISKVTGFYDESYRMVSDSQWHACQPKRTGIRGDLHSGGRRHWCSSLLSCCYCGNRMAARPRAKRRGHQGLVVYCAPCQHARRFAQVDTQPISITSPALWSLCRKVLAEVAKEKKPQIEAYLRNLKPEDVQSSLEKRQNEANALKNKRAKIRERFLLLETSAGDMDTATAEYNAIIANYTQQLEKLEAEIQKLAFRAAEGKHVLADAQKQLNALAGIERLLSQEEPTGKLGQHVRNILREAFPEIRVNPRPIQRCHELTVEFDVALGQLIATQTGTPSLQMEVITRSYTLVTSSRAGKIRILNEHDAEGRTGEVPEGYKRCADCEQAKPLEAFRYGEKSNRLRSYCKPCFTERNRIYCQNRTRKMRLQKQRKG
jgi:DNA invertase Pin-like site-specific DNA recombinase